MNYVVFGTTKVTLMVAIMKKLGISPKIAMHDGFDKKYIEEIHKFATQFGVIIFLLPVGRLGELELTNDNFVPYRFHLLDYGVFIPREKRTKPINEDDIVWMKTLFKNKQITLEQFLRVT